MYQQITLSQATDREVIAAWNVYQFSLRMVCDKSNIESKLNEISSELTVRNIPHQMDKKILVKG